MSFKKALVIQFVLAVLIAGTTTTNMFFSGLILFFLLQKHQIITIKYNKALYPLGFIAFTLILFAFYATYDPANSASSMYNRFFNFRIFESPTVFLQYAISSLTFPIMSAPPLFTEIAPHTITLEPILFSRMHALFLLCTFILLFIIVKALYDMHVNPNKKLLFNLFVSWLLFNIIFHNVWGDDYALYFPHFGFLLFFLLASFCKKLNLTTIFGISTMIIVNQSLFIYDLHSLVHKVG